jgi:hypothetical protein
MTTASDEARSRTELALEAIALRYQIAVLSAAELVDRALPL